jgi:uncharacterized surface protein with fasciclin (FAS1) repeats
MKKFMLKSIITLMTIGIVYGCSSGNQNQGGEKSAPSLEESHPMGQASVSDDESAKNILQVAVGSEAHSTLVAAVQAAQIEHILVNAGPLTVFAPVNDAFAALPAGTVENLLKAENKATLTTILTRHAAPGSYNLEALKKEARKGRKIYTATGDYLEIKVDGEDVFVAGAKVLASIQTTNGVINVVDKVILL